MNEGSLGRIRFLVLVAFALYTSSAYSTCFSWSGGIECYEDPLPPVEHNPPTTLPQVIITTPTEGGKSEAVKPDKDQPRSPFPGSKQDGIVIPPSRVIDLR